MTDAVIEFAKWVIQESVFDGYDLDGVTVQEKALELGLLTKTSYDPEKHGEVEYAEPGSDWYVLSNLLTQTDPSPEPEAQQEPDARPSEQAVTEAWRPIETALKDGNKILAWTPSGLDLVWWSDLEPDGPQEPGHNPGWWGASGETAPGRTPEHGFSGNPSYHWPAQNQPTHWMPLPTPPTAGGGDE